MYDSKPTIQFDNGSGGDTFSITEQTGTQTVTVTLSASSSETVTVDYATDATDSSPVFTAANIITNASNAHDVKAGDIDGDGDIDIVYAAFASDTIAWLENDGANDPSFTNTNVATNQDDANEIALADLDNDGDLDIVSVGDRFIWHENDGAADPSWTNNSLSSDLSSIWDVHIADMDGDGDLDILGGATSGNKIYWLESDGASDPSFTVNEALTSNGSSGVHTADIDGDGDLDIVSAGNSQIAWHENNGLQILHGVLLISILVIMQEMSKSQILMGMAI